MASSSFENLTGVNGDLIGKALTAAMKADRVPGAELYHREATTAAVFFGFRGSFSADDWFAPANHGPFGETTIDRDQFPCLRSIAIDEDATVNEAFLRRLEAVLNGSRSLRDEVIRAVQKRKQIVFTGYSSGSAIAILITVWFLETYLKPEPNRVPPLCVTFGSPLVGDHVFKHALGRENWARYFLNFVTRYDIVPRVMLAPRSSIAQRLPQILHLLDPKTTATFQEGDQTVPDFYVTVMRNISSVASQSACQLMGNTNPLLETLSTFIELSPYRPFGTYVFCTNGRLVAVNNADAILQLLFHSSQLSDETEWPRIAYQSIADHRNYEKELQGFPGTKLLYHLDQLPLTLDGEDLNANSIGAIPSDLGLSTRARLSIRAAIEAEKQEVENQKKIEDKQGDIRSKLEWIENKYKEKCDARRIGYYDSFRASNEVDDFKANVKRAELAGTFDEVIEMLKKGQLPDGFEGRHEWINLATKYRRLIEPLDIANYYRHLKNEDTGPYMEKGRPKRYRYAQRLLEHEQWKSTGTKPENSYWTKVDELNLGSLQDIQEKLKMAGSNCESCFWAEVEELKGKPYEEIWVRARTLETMLERSIERKEADKQMFLDGSTFRKWWDTLPDYHKASSPIPRLMQG